MTSAAQRPQSVVPQSTSPPPSGISFLPTDLYSDEPPLETNFHLRQILLLLSCLEWLWRERSDFFAAANLTVYYNPKQLKTRDLRGPDFFVVLDTDPRPERKSWTVWEEAGKYPNFIVEILSDSTAKVDRTTKKALYQDIWRVPEYFWFDPFSLEFAGFSLVNGTYQPIATTEKGWRWSEQLGLYLGLQDGKLRYFLSDGQLVAAPDEAAIAAKAEVADAKAETADAISEVQALKEKLRSLGVDPDA